MAETHKMRTSDLLPKSQFFQYLNEKAEALAKSCPSALMPSLGHLKMADYETVYEPSDDTYLMIDALGCQFGTYECIPKKMSLPRITLEIGCGTGVSTIFLAKLLSKSQNENFLMSQQQQDQQEQQFPQLSQQEQCQLHGGPIHIVTDINPNAIQITKQTAIENNIDLTSLQFHLCDLAKPLLQSHEHKIDVIIFNPPYVPTPDEEVGSDGIEASWAGGTDGRLVIDQVLPQIARLLSRPNGVAYMITVDDNKPEDIASIMMKDYGITVQPFLRRRARNEFLTVLKMTF